jgi:hypothetical protein
MSTDQQVSSPRAYVEPPDNRSRDAGAEAHLVDSFDFSFGTTPCEVRVEEMPHVAGRGSLFVARAFAWEKEGRALRPIAEPDGQVSRIHSDRQRALQEILVYLLKRFGEVGPPPRWHEDNLGPVKL